MKAKSIKLFIKQVLFIYQNLRLMKSKSKDTLMNWFQCDEKKNQKVLRLPKRVWCQKAWQWSKQCQTHKRWTLNSKTRCESTAIQSWLIRFIPKRSRSNPETFQNENSKRPIQIILHFKIDSKSFSKSRNGLWLRQLNRTDLKILKTKFRFHSQPCVLFAILLLFKQNSKVKNSFEITWSRLSLKL